MKYLLELIYTSKIFSKKVFLVWKNFTDFHHSVGIWFENDLFDIGRKTMYFLLYNQNKQQNYLKERMFKPKINKIDNPFQLLSRLVKRV